MRIRTTVLAIVLACLSACALPTLKLDAIATEQQLFSSDAVEVRLDPAEFKRIDVHQDMLFKKNIETGVFWQRAFIGKDGDPAFTIHSAILKTNYEGAGFVARYTYVIEGELKLPARSYPIHAEGTRAAGFALIQAQKQAVELGIKSAAEQCRQVMSR
jgi:hypothetical protein